MKPKPYKNLTEKELLGLAIMEDESSMMCPPKLGMKPKILHGPQEVLDHLGRTMALLDLEDRLNRSQEPTRN